MGKEATPAAVITPEGQSATPEVLPAQVPDPAEELRREQEKLKKQLADKDKYISELQSEKQVLEARATVVQRPPEGGGVDTDLQKETSQILEMAQVDPQKAGEQLAGLIQKAASKAQQDALRNIEPIITQQTFVNEVKAKNQDLIDLGLEPSITLRTNQLMQSGKPFKDAVDVAVAEARAKVEKLKSSNAPAQPTPPPAGAVGERGNNAPPAPKPPEVETTMDDEIRAARERRRKSGL